MKTKNSLCFTLFFAIFNYGCLRCKPVEIISESPCRGENLETTFINLHGKWKWDYAMNVWSNNKDTLLFNGLVFDFIDNNSFKVNNSAGVNIYSYSFIRNSSDQNTFNSNAPNLPTEGRVGLCSTHLLFNDMDRDGYLNVFTKIY